MKRETGNRIEAAVRAAGTDTVERAMAIALAAHRGQQRKSGSGPVIMHPARVACRLSGVGAGEVAIAAGWLHDTIEDTGMTYPYLAEAVGEAVAGVVYECSEPDKSAPWRERKLHTIHAIPGMSTEAAQVTAADKEDNLRDLLAQIDREGGSDRGILRVMKCFHPEARSIERQMWYFATVSEALSGRASGGVEADMAEGLSREVERLRTLK